MIKSNSWESYWNYRNTQGSTGVTLRYSVSESNSPLLANLYFWGYHSAGIDSENEF
jgi:hypothetical protein